jgi:Iron-sulfur cluster-binding domain
MREYWSERGAMGFLPFSLVNRAGSLPVDEQVEAWHAFRPEAKRMLQEKGDAAHCWIPFLYPFIGYDGNYQLCSSDWRKEVVLGNVFDHALVDLLDGKAEQVCGRSPICGNCTHEPTNALALSLARAAGGSATDTHCEPNATPNGLLDALDHYAGCVSAMRANLPQESIVGPPTNRRLIPVRS